MTNAVLSAEQIALLEQSGMPVVAPQAQPAQEVQTVKYDRKGTHATAAIRGNVGQNPGMKGNIFMFSVATELSISDGLTTKKFTDWHTIAVRNSASNAGFIAFCQANIVQGSRVSVSGRITSTKTGGIIIHATKIEVRRGEAGKAKDWLVSDGTTREYNPEKEEAAS